MSRRKALTTEGRLSQTKERVGATVSMFTNFIDSLKSCNDELEAVKEEARATSQRYQSIQTEAEMLIEDNSKIIQKVNAILQ